MIPTNIIDVWGRYASKIDTNHYQSGFPFPFQQVPKCGVDVVVLTANDAQPDSESLRNIKRVYPNLGGIRCPFLDTENLWEMPRIARIANDAADRIVEKLASGRVVLVTCAQGRNRSGLVSALVLMRRRGLSGRDAVAQVRAGRNAAMPLGEGALTNEMFVAYLESLRRV